jgi:hypothetical protein
MIKENPMRRIKLFCLGLFASIGCGLLLAFLWIPCRWYGTDTRYYPDWADGFGVAFWIVGCAFAIGFVIWYVVAMGKRIK